MININEDNAWKLFFKTGMPQAYVLYRKARDAHNICIAETAEEIAADISGRFENKDR